MRISRLSVILVAMTGALLAPATWAADGENVFKSVGCAACHAPDQPRVGPTLKAVAAKYKGQANAVDMLAGKVRGGSKDVWGKVPMPPVAVAQVGDADLKAAIGWILTH